MTLGFLRPPRDRDSYPDSRLDQQGLAPSCPGLVVPLLGHPISHQLSSAVHSAPAEGLQSFLDLDSEFILLVTLDIHYSQAPRWGSGRRRRHLALHFLFCGPWCEDSLNEGLTMVVLVQLKPQGSDTSARGLGTTAELIGPLNRGTCRHPYC